MTTNGQFDVLVIYSSLARTTVVGSGVETTSGGKCCYCHDEFLIEDFYIGDAESAGYGTVCHVCAWQRASNLMRLIQLYEDNVRFAASPPVVPQPVRAELTRRANDPRRLKSELKEALEALDNHGHGAPSTSPLHTSPLAKMVAERINTAQESGNVEAMQEAKRLYEEASHGAVFPENLDDDLPF